MIFVAGKAAFFALAFAIPLQLHSIGAVVILYATASGVAGMVLSVVFQVAQFVELLTKENVGESCGQWWAIASRLPVRAPRRPVFIALTPE